MKRLDGVKVAIVATNGFEQSELVEPRKALEAAGAQVDVVSLEAGTICGWKDGDWADEVEVDYAIERARPEDYDALVLPGGVLNPDKLRGDAKIVAFVRSFTAAGKPVAAICHGPSTLIETGALRGHMVTSYPSIKTDLINAGASWVDEEVVVDRGLITSRTPDDLPAFNRKLIEQVAERARQRARSADAAVSSA
jgi:protease I